ncbi:MAG: UDP-glucose--hexose-1-phosphate uridylyltransferase [Clostridiales bacterium]|nr:UDP-glucose--hexose-1-phosphate uridylyltransferase [Clostridiales bacterium]
MISQQEVKQKLQELVLYAQKNLSIKDADVNYITNQLIDLFHFDSPAEKATSYPENFQEEVLDKIVQYAVENKMIEENEKLLFETKIMGMVSLLPSQTIEKFDAIAANGTIKDATDWFFNVSKASNYIRVKDIAKNIKWSHDGKLGKIDITINLSKPEKDPKQIALEKSRPKSGYPACLLCLENVGYAGHISHPARQTLRTIPMTLNNEAWSLQYSPYQYFEEHLIALCNEHRPMNVTIDTIKRLLDFVDLFPHYFLGSNASLPIVGGSILSHDHYQGGAKVLPMFAAKNKHRYENLKYKDVQIYTINWYNSVVRLESENKENITKQAKEVLDNWFNYSDESVGIIAKEEEPHNAITPIVRKEGNKYIIDMILRNNRTNKEFPDGIFHAAPHLHNIKKEGIGLIEVMGLFILPGRLQKEFAGIEDILTGKTPFDPKELTNPENPLSKHFGMIAQLVNDNGTSCNSVKAKGVITKYVNAACEEILECTAVFKNTEVGQAAFDKFLKEGLSLKD